MQVEECYWFAATDLGGAFVLLDKISCDPLHYTLNAQLTALQHLQRAFQNTLLFFSAWLYNYIVWLRLHYHLITMTHPAYIHAQLHLGSH